MTEQKQAEATESVFIGDPRIPSTTRIMGRRIGPRMFWTDGEGGGSGDDGGDDGGNDGTGEGDGGAASNEQTVKELQRELAQTKAKLTRFGKLEEKVGKMEAADEAARIKQAEEQGEWQSLASEAKANVAALQKQLDAAQEGISSRDEFLQGMVAESLAGVADKAARKDLEEGGLQGLNPKSQLRILAAFHKATGGQPPAAPAAKRGGKPGPAKKTEMTDAEKSRNTPAAAAQRKADVMAQLKEQGIQGFG